MPRLLNFIRTFPLTSRTFLHPIHRKRTRSMEGNRIMKRLLFWGTLIAGATAAYLMYRRGESLGTIAAQAVTNPVGSLVTELKTASS